jgi:uncharacterized membrane protein
MKKKIKSIFISGLIVMIILGLLYKIAMFVINITQPIKVLLTGWFNWNFPGLEILVAITVIFTIGLLINLCKGKLWQKAGKIPGIREIKAIRATAEKLVKEGQVVKIPLFGPISVIGFTDANSLNGDEENILVFAPNSPLIFTGWMVLVPRDKITPVTGNLKKVIGLIVSGGLLVNDSVFPK